MAEKYGWPPQVVAHIPLPALFRLLGVEDVDNTVQGRPMTYPEVCELTEQIRQQYSVSSGGSGNETG